MTRNTSLHSHPWDTALDPQIAPLFLALQWAHQRSLAAMQPILAEYRLSAAEFDVLATLRNAPAPHRMTPSEIRYQMVITSGGLTKVMAQLADRGLVERLTSEDDQRSKPVALSAAGKALIETAMPEMLSVTGGWLHRTLSVGEIAELTRLLGKVLATEANA